MTQQILGPSGSPRRRWTVFVPLLVAFALGLMYVAGAQAVHDDGVFALEGNATTGNECTNPPTNNIPSGCDPRNPVSITTGEDWDQVEAGTDSADETAFETDTTLSGGLAGAGDSILSQDTKDIQAISAWTWKQTGSTSVQDKADIEHAYAAQYGDLLYFGADRFSNSGDTVMGFWFFRSGVAKVGPDAQGNGTFTGTHTARVDGPDPGDPPLSRGDILIVSDFRQGGKAPQIQVYEWVASGGSASANLDLIGGGPNPASCTQAPGERQNDPPVPPVSGGDPLCATANQFIITSPWLYDAKSNSGGTSGDNGAGKFGVATFMEGGIDLGFFGFADTCFSSFMAETRASHSVTSTLSDFVLGEFGACESELTTTPANGSGTPLTDSDVPPNGLADIQIGTGSLGANVTDNASVNVTGVGTWTGTVSFFICGPIATGTCDTGGVAAGVKPVSNTTTTAMSNVVNLTSVGRYCWRGFFESPTEGVPDATDASTGECFEVKPVTPTLSTTGGPDVTLGTAITDTATLSGTANQPGTNGGTLPGQAGSEYPSINATNGAAAGGTISWTLRGPGDCNDAGLTITGSPVDVNGDNASYGPVSATPLVIGTYTWVATYSGSSPNTLGAAGSCPPGANDGDEEVTVTGVSGLTTEQDWLPNDTATLTGPTNLNGTLTFVLYNDGTCGDDGGTAVYTEPDITVTAAASGTTFNTTNQTFLVKEADSGSYSWLVTYDDDNLADPDPACETTTITITD
jgi:hypothetical protein